MKQFIKGLIGMAVTVVGAYAGQIQIGGVNGLTKAYLTNTNAGGANGCQNVGPTATNVGCASDTSLSTLTGTTGYSSLGYTTSLFGSAAGIAAAPGYAALPNQGALSAQSSITDNTIGGAPVTFALINESTAAAPVNFYAPKASNSVSLDIPIGIFAVDRIWTMISDIYGVAGLQSVDLTFVFGSTSTDLTGPQAVVHLNEGPSNAASANLQIQTGVNCTSANSNIGATATGNVNGGTVGDCRNYSGSGSAPGVSSLWTGTYTSIAANSGMEPYRGTTNGVLTLDDQYLKFASLTAFSSINYSNLYLTQLKISNVGFAASTSNPAYQSRAAISAVTVNSTFAAAATSNPEPSTLLLFGGAGLIGLAWARKRRV